MSQDTKRKNTALGLNMKPIDPQVLSRMRTVFETKTLPKIKADTKRNARNVAIARNKVMFC